MSVDDKQSVGKLSLKIKPKGGIFDGLDIAVSNLNTCLSDDTKSVHSLAKTFRSVKRSLGGKSLKKDDKKKLRHDMFLSKIDAFYKNRENLKKNKKGPVDMSIKDLDKALPAVDMVFHKSDKKVKEPRPVSTKQKGIKKAKQRQKELEQNYEAFKKIMEDVKSKEKILDVVTEHVHQTVLSQIG
ncbi:hypothetical protein GE061_004173 [Apolygus lucorum]|uniref:Uncharacterized protein n=1 Tax=Apolygus lucorum TaxID=248454 RepID=A0A8S9X079_APOLU|nr:hypothetical protein GE061_004173 [Apolygus lucorum]